MCVCRKVKVTGVATALCLTKYSSPYRLRSIDVAVERNLNKVDIFYLWKRLVRRYGVH
jgi:hypothetical protein